MSEHSLDTLKIYCTESDFIQNVLQRNTMKSPILPPTSRRRRSIATNCFILGLPFLVGLSFGVPITYFTLHVCDSHQSRDSALNNSFYKHKDSVSERNDSQEFVNIYDSLKNRVDDVSGSHEKARTVGNLLTYGRRQMNDGTIGQTFKSLSPKNSRNVEAEERRKNKILSEFGAEGSSDISNYDTVPASYNSIDSLKPRSVNMKETRRTMERSYASNGIIKEPIIGSKINQSDIYNKTLRLLEVVNGIYWTSEAEDRVPKGFDDSDINAWRKFLNITQVLKIEEGCGRMQNRLITLDGGEKSCCRYRHNNDQIQGEIFSFYLGRLLAINNLLPSALALVRPREHRWFSAASQVALAQWSSERPVVLTKYVEELQPVYIPVQFRSKDNRRLHPTIEDIIDYDIKELVQWSDLIIFDYLTANLDRTVNNMYNERWNKDMMKQPTHNLARTPEGLLLFLDNESGLLHGYRLLEKYEHFHKSLLSGLCVFRRRTAQIIKKLHTDNNADIILKQSFINGDPGMAEWLPFLPDRSVRILKQRIFEVYEHINTCEKMFLPSSKSLELSVSASRTR